jgi:hypothetical protein
VLGPWSTRRWSTGTSGSTRTGCRSRSWRSQKPSRGSARRRPRRRTAIGYTAPRSRARAKATLAPTSKPGAWP